MRTRLLPFFLLVGLSLASQPPLAATLHVAITGADGNPGTASAPFRTIKHGTTRLQAGDTLLIGPGVYAEGEIYPPSGTTLRAATGDRPILRPGGGDNIIHVTNRQDITLDGLDLDGSNGGNGRAVQFPLYGTDGEIRNITITNSMIHHGHASCVLVSGERWTITNNHIHHCGVDTTYDHGVYFTGSHSLMANNHFEHAACFAIHNYADPHGTAKVTPSHNTYDSNVLGASGCGVALAHGTGLMFRNNLLLTGATQADFGGAAVASQSRGQVVVEGNLFWRGGVSGRDGEDAGLLVQGNTLCEGKIETHQATVRDNRYACAGLDVEAEVRKRVTGRSGAGQARPPAPTNLRIVVVP